MCLWFLAFHVHPVCQLHGHDADQSSPAPTPLPANQPPDSHCRARCAQLWYGAGRWPVEAWPALLQPVRAAWTPWWLLWLIPLIELFSFLIRPFSLALRLFVAMTAGHVLMKVLAGFVINGLNAEALWVAPLVALPSFILMIGITLLELLVCAIQAYVFALLTSLYINDAVNLH